MFGSKYRRERDALADEKRKREFKKAKKLAKKQIKDLRKFRGLGETFDYLSIKMLVIGHSEGGYHGWAWRNSKGYLTYHAIREPRLFCEYVQLDGHIKKISFEYSELETLKTHCG